MSGVYRSMFADGRKPLVGDGSKMLGVRGNGHDIPISAEDMVLPNTGGLSIAPEWRDLPYFLIPRRLQDSVPEARGNNKLTCFRLSDLPFKAAEITDKLALRPDTAKHGTIEPRHEMKLDVLQSALSDTRNLWEIDEK